MRMFKRLNIIKRMVVWLAGILFNVLYKINNKIYMKYYPRYLKYIGIKIHGQPTFISPTASFDATDYTKISIGNHVVISGEVRLLTHDYSVSRIAEAKGQIDKKEFRFIDEIEIGENSFIGTRTIIMPGVKIGKNVIIGAGSVVTKDVSDNLIVAGNPAREVSNIDEYWKKYLKNQEKYYYE